MESRWYLGLVAGTVRPTVAAYAADLNLTHAQATEQAAQVNRAIAAAEAQLSMVDDYALYFHDACKQQETNPAQAAQPMPFTVWLAAQNARR